MSETYTFHDNYIIAQIKNSVNKRALAIERNLPGIYNGRAENYKRKTWIYLI